MAYDFVKYRITFRDKHISLPADWRIDILPEGGTVLASPIKLRPSSSPLTLEYTNTDENKRSWIIGRKATIRYVYDGEGSPLPTEFADQDERFYRVEIYKNGSQDGIYYIKPDNLQFDFRYPPFDIVLTAVDGFAYAKTVDFDMYQNGLLMYDKINLYEAIISRALKQVLDSNVIVNLINTLLPENAASGARLLNDVSVHTDMFYDFVEGPISVYDVLTYFCKTFYARLFIANNKVWFIRTSDMDQGVVTTEQYTDADNVTDLVLPIDSILGPNVGLFDGVPVRFNGRIRCIAAVKKAKFKVEYKSINRIQNFDWRGFTGTDFPGWTRFNANIYIDRVGSGSVDDPYRAVIKRDPPAPTTTRLTQDLGAIMNKNDLLEFSFKFKFNGTTSFRIGILAYDPTIVGFFRLSGSGDWVYNFGTDPVYIPMQRSGKKRNGSFSIKANPMSEVEDSRSFPNTMHIQIAIFPPEGKYNPAGPDYNPLLGPPEDGVASPDVEIYPLKLGVITMSATGRQVNIVNKARYSVEQDNTDFQFIDTGETGLSNTLFVGDAPASTWKSPKVGVFTKDIEQHMAQANIDQYAKSLNAFESTIYSNNIEFYNRFAISSIQDKRFIMLTDSYDVIECQHDVMIEEVLPEQGAEVDYTENDIDDSEN